MNFCPGELILKLLARIGEWHQNLNEMVSLGDTAISLHKLQPPTAKGGGGGGVFWKVKTQSAKIWVNFNFQRGGGGCSGKSKPKVPRFQFSGGGVF